LLRQRESFLIRLVSLGQGIEDCLHRLLHGLVALCILHISIASIDTFALNLLRRKPIPLLYTYPPQLVQ